MADPIKPTCIFCRDSTNPQQKLIVQGKPWFRCEDRNACRNRALALFHPNLTRP